MLTRRSLSVLTVLPIAAVILSGCGGGSSGGSAPPPSTTPSSPATSPSSGQATNGIDKLDAKAALQKVIAATGAIHSAHIVGTVDQGGKPLKIDVHADGDKGIGSLQLGGGSIQLIQTDAQTVYFKADRAGLIASGATPTQAAQAANKWIRESASSAAAASFLKLLSVHAFFNEVLAPKGTVVKGDVSTVDGQLAYSLKDTGTKDSGTLYVAATGEALPIKVVSDARHGSVTFSDYDQPITVTAPAHSIQG